MALSDVDICNMALGHLGRSSGPISALTEKSPEARLCSIWYNQSRREVLEVQDWSFARTRLALALHSDAPPDEWAFRYQVPSDSVIIRRLYNPYVQFASVFGNAGALIAGDLSDAVPYELESSMDGQSMTLLTNMESASAVYTRDLTLPQMFSPQFVNALSHYIAAKIAFAVTGKPQIADTEAKAFQSAMRAAAGSDANQGMAGPMRDAYSVRARA